MTTSQLKTWLSTRTKFFLAIPFIILTITGAFLSVSSGSNQVKEEIRLSPQASEAKSTEDAENSSNIAAQPTGSQIPSKTKNESISLTTQSSNASTSSLEYIFFIVLLIFLGLSILTNFLFYKGHLKSKTGQLVRNPKDLSDNFKESETIKKLISKLIDFLDNKLSGREKDFRKMLEDDFSEIKKMQSANIEQSKKESETTKKMCDDVMESFTVLQTELSGREKEIKRLKKGYDSEVFRKFLGRFIRVDKMLREEINKMRAATSENDANLRILIELQEMLIDAFEECGVSAFSPDVGSYFLKAFGVADNPKTIPASSIEADWTIAEVIKPGFKIESLEGPDQCIEQAKVVVFKFKKGD
jgi:hypothetical protein